MHIQRKFFKKQIRWWVLTYLEKSLSFFAYYNLDLNFTSVLCRYVLILKKIIIHHVFWNLSFDTTLLPLSIFNVRHELDFLKKIQKIFIPSSIMFEYISFEYIFLVSEIMFKKFCWWGMFTFSWVINWCWFVWGYHINTNDLENWMLISH